MRIVKDEKTISFGADQLALAKQLYAPNPRRQQIDRAKDCADYHRFYLTECRDKRPVPDDEGWALGGACPFKPGCPGNLFMVNIASGRARCDCCSGSTDALGFLMLRHNLTFKESLEILKGMKR